MSLQLRQGLDIDRQGIIFDEGEIIYCTDTKEVWIGDGETVGALSIGYYDHEHDDRYYTKDEIDEMTNDYVSQLIFNDHVNNADLHFNIDDTNISTDSVWSSQKIQSIISTHTHDIRYYQKAEIDLMFDSIDDPNTLMASDNDTVPGYLDDKLDVGNGLKKEILNAGSNETIEISSLIFKASFNGQPDAAFYDTARDRVLSASTTILNFSLNRVFDYDWFSVGWATDSSSGYVIPFDATIVGFSAVIANDNTYQKSINLFIGTTQTTLFTTTGGGYNQIYSNTSIDVNQGDKIRIRAGQGGNRLDNVSIQIFLKNRSDISNVLSD